MAYLTDEAAKALLVYLQQHHLTIAPEFRRGVLQLTLQALMEWEVSAAIHAGHYERVGSRRTYRNGYRERVYLSRVGEITLHIPKLRQGTYTPRFLQAAEGLILDWSAQVFIQDAGGEDIRALQAQLDLPAVSADEYERLALQLNRLRERAHRARLESAYQSLEVDSLPINARQRMQLITGKRADGQTELIAFDSGRERSADELMAALARRGVQTVRMTSPARTLARLNQAVSPVYLPRFIWQQSDEATLLRLLTQVRNLQQSEITVALSDLMLPVEDTGLMAA